MMQYVIINNKVKNIHAHIVNILCKAVTTMIDAIYGIDVNNNIYNLRLTDIGLLNNPVILCIIYNLLF